MKLKKIIKKLRNLKKSDNLESINNVDLLSCVGDKDSTILEIGCNNGSDTNRFLKLFPKAKIYCFEPDPRALVKFEDNVRSSRVFLNKVAISDKNGVIEFYASDGMPAESYQQNYPKGWDASGSIRKPTGHLIQHPWCKFDNVINVKTVTLDTWASTNNIRYIDFIWADVQGAEIDVIKGGIETLKKTKYLYTEYSDDELYHGQATLEQMLEIIPFFIIERKYINDVLLRNTLVS
ncbi:MAG: FkbM family methyltransferase [Gammaproteobacteria bacterium]|nr:FkbM family methyltransferase [Gammaproteobacteria bacterium]